jgi:tRNA A37 threonylcarbamoyladenosine dehydratase
MNEDYLYRFSGISRLYGKSQFEKLSHTHACVVGIGGVGTWTAEALARSGVGEITLVDMDEVCRSNVNRQLHALDGEIGKSKTGSMKERLLKINPNLKVNEIFDFFTSDTVNTILRLDYSVVVDCIDSVSNKALLISECKKRNIKIVTTGGAGGKQDPTQIQVADLAKTINDKLLLRVRKKLSRDFGFPKGGKRKFHIPCVYSKEFAKYPGSDGEICEVNEEGQNLRLDCESGYGTATFITGTFGFFAAHLALQCIMEDNGKAD